MKMSQANFVFHTIGIIILVGETLVSIWKEDGSIFYRGLIFLLLFWLIGNEQQIFGKETKKKE